MNQTYLIYHFSAGTANRITISYCVKECLSHLAVLWPRQAALEEASKPCRAGGESNTMCCSLNIQENTVVQPSWHRPRQIHRWFTCALLHLLKVCPLQRKQLLIPVPAGDWHVPGSCTALQAPITDQPPNQDFDPWWMDACKTLMRESGWCRKAEAHGSLYSFIKYLWMIF